MRRQFTLLALTTLALAACGNPAEQAEAPAATEVAANAVVETPTAVAADQGRLNPNTATEAELQAAGLDAAAATAIVAGRPYADQVAFDQAAVAAMGEERAKALYTAVFVPVNLNTASRESIALIPGMTPRMIREFLEYRPYDDMAEFNREIGKYVDEAETARLASYVTLD